MTDATTTESTEASAVSAETQSVVAELEYKHDHHIPSEAEYPSDESLRNKLEETFTPGCWRIYVYRKKPNWLAINCITIRGIRTDRDIPQNLDADDIERAILSIAHRDATRKVNGPATYLIRIFHKVGAGQRSKKREGSFELIPSADGTRYDYGSADSSQPPREGDAPQVRWNSRVSTWSGEGSEPAPSPRDNFREHFSPFSDTSRTARDESWRAKFDKGEGSPPPRKFNADDEAGKDHQHALANRRRQLFSGDMAHESAGGGNHQRQYTENVLPYELLNRSTALCYQAFAGAFDMLSSASHEQARLHGLQMAQMLDREQQLMSLPLRFMEIEAENRGYHAEQVREGHQAYLEALRVRGEMNQRELVYERQNMTNQFQISESQRALVEQQEKHRVEQGSTFRRDLMTGMGPMLLQGVGLFLDYFGQQKLGVAAKGAANLVTGMMGAAGGQQPAGPQAHVRPGQGPTPPRPTAPPMGAQIPRRSLRILDVATEDEVRMQPVRSLCRMVDAAFSDQDRQRMQGVLTPDEWSGLERSLRASSDQECIGGLAGVMLSVAVDEARKNQMLAALTPGQRELFEKIGAFINGQGEVDSTYEVVIRPGPSRMRTVMQQQTAPADDIPVPPPNLDMAPVPPPDLDTVATPVVEDDLPRPTPRAAQADPPPPPNPEPAPAPPGLEQMLLAQMQEMQAQMRQIQQDGADQMALLRAEIQIAKNGGNPETKVIQAELLDLETGASEPVVPPARDRPKRSRVPRKPGKTD